MKILHNIYIKIIAFILFFTCITGIIAVGMNFTKQNISDIDSLRNPNFKETYKYIYPLQEIYSKLCVLGDFYLGNMKEDGSVALSDSQKETLRNIGVFNQNNEITTLSENFIYYVSNGKHSISNSTYKLLTEAYVKSNFNTYYYRIENRRYSSAGDDTNILNNKYTHSYENQFFENYQDNNAAMTIYLAPKNEYIAQNQEIIAKEAEQAKKIILQLIPLIAAAFLLAVIQIIITGNPDRNPVPKESDGKRPEEGRIPGELVIAAMGTCVFLLFVLLGDYSGFRYWIELFTSQFLVFQLIYGLAGAILCGAFFLGFLYLVRRLKQRNLIRSSLCYIILSKIMQMIKMLWRSFFITDVYKKHTISKRLFTRQIVFVALIGFLLLLSLLFAASHASFLGFLTLMIVLVFIFLYLYQNNQDFKDMSVLCEHISQLYSGNSEFHSAVTPDSPVYEPAMQLNNISEGVKKSVDQQVKAERIKIDLVTNVSHDLKTPLTSIIGYIDLLSKQELSPEATDYVKILEIKADRLKKIVSDLFELAKITSGNEELVLEELDCVVLVNQVVADMEDAILVSGKSIKIHMEQETALIYADGSKLYRVFQNLLDNALKYSMDGTRIFLNLKVVGNEVTTMIKNTSSYELDFSTEEILERFTRGDKSRSSEGNGLGLSIAKGFANACGGDLKVEIDGDLFKVSVTFPIYTAS